MHTAADRPEFAPPQPPGLLRALLLALVAHLLLIAALTFSVRWKNDAENATVEAELWSAVPQQAAPKLVEAPPPPPPPPPQPRAETRPPPPPPVSDADIALEREKKRRVELEKQRREELQRQEALREQREREKEAQQKKLAQEKAAKEKAEKAAQEKAARDKQLEQQRQKEQQDAKRKADQQADKAREQKEAEAQRRKNLERLQGLAGATGDANATGTAQRSSGPSAGYAGRIRGRIKPNIVFTDDVAGNPMAEIEVRTSPDGTIVGRRLLKSSGVKSWDEAALRAIDKTEVLPRDTDGRVPPILILELRPKD